MEAQLKRVSVTCSICRNKLHSKLQLQIDNGSHKFSVCVCSLCMCSLIVWRLPQAWKTWGKSWENVPAVHYNRSPCWKKCAMTRCAKSCWSTYIAVDWNLICLNQCEKNQSGTHGIMMNTGAPTSTHWQSHLCQTLVTTSIVHAYEETEGMRARIQCQVDWIILDCCSACINPS